MPARYGRYYRRRFRSTRRYRRRTTYKRRFKRVRRYRRRGTASSVIKLTQDATWNLNDGQATPRWNAFSFSPVSLPGFSDYQATYSHFRILKAKLYVSRTIGDNDGSLYNYLVVGVDHSPQPVLVRHLPALLWFRHSSRTISDRLSGSVSIIPTQPHSECQQDSILTQ